MLLLRVLLCVFLAVITAGEYLKGSQSDVSSSNFRGLAEIEVSKLRSAKVFKLTKNGNGDNENEHGNENENGNGDNENENENVDAHDHADDNDSKDDPRLKTGRFPALPQVYTPALSTYVQNSSLTYSVSGLSDYQPINITVVQSFFDIDGSIFSNSTLQQLFQDKLGLTISSLLVGINASNVNFNYALLNNTSLYSGSRRLLTLQNYIVKYSMTYYSLSTDMVNISTTVKGFRNILVNATRNGDFNATFYNYTSDIPELSSASFFIAPYVYQASYPPPSGGKLYVTQRFDYVNMTEKSYKKDNNKNIFRDIIAGTINSFLIETQIKDIKVQDITYKSFLTFDVDYRISLKFNRTYAQAYANLFKKSINDGVIQGLLTSQLRLASTSTYYNNSRFNNASATILPTYKLKFDDDNNSEGGGENEDESHTNKTKVRTLRVMQPLNNVDTTLLSSPTEYEKFVTIMKQTVSDILGTIPTSDIDVYGYEKPAGRRMLVVGSTVNVNYGVNVYSTTTDPTTVNALTSDVTNSLTTATTNGDFTNAFVSAAVANDALGFTTASASSAPTVTSSSSGSTTTQPKNDFSLTSGPGIAVLILIIILLPLLLITGIVYYCVVYSAKESGTTTTTTTAIYGDNVVSPNGGYTDRSADHHTLMKY